MTFMWNGHEVQLKGISKKRVYEITSSQLKRYKQPIPFAAFYHLQLSSLKGVTNSESATPPPYILPLIQKYKFLFQEPTTLSPNEF